MMETFRARLRRSEASDLCLDETRQTKRTGLVGLVWIHVAKDDFIPANQVPHLKITRRQQILLLDKVSAASSGLICDVLKTHV